MRLTIVGCSGSYPGPDSPASCYLLEHDGHRILLDMGNGSVGALHRYGDPYDLDAILISHLHVDHCIDLTSYYVMRTWHPDGAHPCLPVYGPAGTQERPAAEAPSLAATGDIRPGPAGHFSAAATGASSRSRSKPLSLTVASTPCARSKRSPMVSSRNPRTPFAPMRSV